MLEALVVVDMQRHFSPIPTAVTDAVIDEIRWAKANRQPIVVLEFDGCDETLTRIKHCIGKYQHAAFVTKYNQDGSGHVLAALACLNLETTAMRVCGLYTSACVAATVEGLVESDCEVCVKAAACYDDDENCHFAQIENWLDRGVTVW